MVDHSFSCPQYLCAEGHLNSDVVVVVVVIGILVLFSVAGVIGVGAGVETSSEAW